MVMEQMEKIVLFMKAQKVSKFKYFENLNYCELRVEWSPEGMIEMPIEFKPKTEDEVLRQELEDALRSV